MSNLTPDERDVPASPNELRGPIGGVTRIGPRALGLAFFVIIALLVAILYGLNRGSSYSKGPQTDAFNTPPPAIPTGESRFGANEPLVATAAPTVPPPILLPSNVPNLENENKTTTSGASAQQNSARQAQESADQQRADQARAAEDARRHEAEEKRRQLLLAALKSPILTGDSQSAGGQGNVAFAGNGGGQSDGTATFASYNAGSQATGSGSGSAVVPSRPADRPTPSGVSPSAYLEGPTGQYAVQPANVTLPEGGNPKDFLQAQRFAPKSPFEIVASSVIPASMITAITTDVPGLMSAQVREDVYDSKTGRYLLIPKGSRLVGLYKNDVSFGQTRVLVAWTRLIFPDTTSIDLENMSGADVEGNGGVSGTVDNHYGAIFGAAILTSVLAAGAELSQPQNSSILAAPNASQEISSGIGQQISQTGTQILQKQINVPPTLHIPKGYPFIIFVDRDMVLPGPYRKP